MIHLRALDLRCGQSLKSDSPLERSFLHSNISRLPRPLTTRDHCQAASTSSTTTGILDARYEKWSCYIPENVCASKLDDSVSMPPLRLCHLCHLRFSGVFISLEPKLNRFLDYLAQEWSASLSARVRKRSNSPRTRSSSVLSRPTSTKPSTAGSRRLRQASSTWNPRNPSTSDSS